VLVVWIRHLLRRLGRLEFIADLRDVRRDVDGSADEKRFNARRVPLDERQAPASYNWLRSLVDRFGRDSVEARRKLGCNGRQDVTIRHVRIDLFC
jgi:hypothetical protein